MTSKREVGPEAREWHDLIREVHDHDGSGQDADDPEPDPSAPDARAVFHDDLGEEIHRSRLDDSFQRMVATPGGKAVVALIVLILVLLALAFLPDWGADDVNTPPGEGVGATAAEPRRPDDAG